MSAASLETKDDTRLFALYDFSPDASSGASDDDDASDGNGTTSWTGPFSASAMPMGGPPVPTQSDDNLDDIVINYNDRFATASPALFRDEIVDQLMGVLIGKNKPNAVLVGPAGSGKTRIVEELARLIANKDERVPNRISKTTVYELPLSNLVAGASLVGQLEGNVKRVLEYMEDPANDAILFIDEIHMLTDDRSGVYDKIAQMLKPALARGDIRVIGATTLQEATSLMSDPAFSRRFSRLICDELTPEQTIEVMKSVTGALSLHYQGRVRLNDDVLRCVRDAADKWSAPGMHRPDNALTLLDRTCADAFMDRMHAEAQLKKGDPAIYKQFMQTSQITITPTRVKRTAISLMTGHARIADLDEVKLASALDHIKGQDTPISTITDALRRRDLGLFETKRPLSVLCAGASGVGKTACARAIAAAVTDTVPIMLNMTEYNDATTVNRIVGSPDGYVGSDSKQELPFDILQSNPYQVILLDEFEKADRAVQRLFMSVLEEGSLRTSRGIKLDFSHAIVIATTNAGSGAATKRAIGFSEQDGNASAKAVSSLAAWFDPELLNRFTHIVQFNPISREIYSDIMADTYCRTRATVVDTSPQLAAVLDPELSNNTLEQMVADTYVPEFGARPIEKAVQAHIEETVLAYRQMQTGTAFASNSATPSDIAINTDGHALDAHDIAISTTNTADAVDAVDTNNPTEGE